ncbi:MAG: DNA mismatch repair endonuclease MutL [Nitrospirota bacterium]
MKIKILPEDIINKIAAGEIIERPSSVVKELIENSIDAKSSKICADIMDGGKKMIRVIDDGEGMNRDDALLAFERHATSKLKEEKDLYFIKSLGFRGEALPSIASVSKVSLTTMSKGSDIGIQVDIDGGMVRDISETGRSVGTTIEISHLFYNTPARRKFLKKTNTELSHISRLFYQEALAHPWIHFRMNHNGKEVANYPSVKGWRDKITQIFGDEISSNIIEIEESSENISFKGFISKPLFTKRTNLYQEIFINRRHIKSSFILHAIYDSYDTLLMKDQHPVIFMFLEVDPSSIDVNVHPAKREIKFSNQREVYNFIRNSIRNKLSAGNISVAGSHSIAEREINNQRDIRDSGDFRYQYNLADDQSGIGENKRIKESVSHYQPVAETEFCSASISSLSHNIRPLGQINNTFIIVEIDNELQIIDQHTAHERVLYEKYTKAYRKSGCDIQPLLIPENIELSLQETLLIKDYIKDLKKIGLEIEEFGENSFIIRAIPAIGCFGSLQKLVIDIINELAQFEKNMSYEERIKKIISSFACHGAVRANHVLNKEEITRLIEDLLKTDMPYTCPHGRPIAIRFTIEELEKRFYRK